MKVKKKPRAKVIIAAVNAVLIIAIAVSAVASYIVSYKDRDESSVSSQTAGESKKKQQQKRQCSYSERHIRSIFHIPGIS